MQIETNEKDCEGERYMVLKTLLENGTTFLNFLTIHFPLLYEYQNFSECLIYLISITQCYQCISFISAKFQSITMF